MSDYERAHLPELELDRAPRLGSRLAAERLPQAEQRYLVAQLEAFQRVQKVVANANRFRSPEQRLDALLHEYVRVIPGAQRGALYLCTPETHGVSVGAAYPPQPDLIGSAISAQGSHVDATAQLGTPALLDDVQAENPLGYLSPANGPPAARSALLWPFVVGSRTVGVLVLENTDRTNAFTQSDLAFATLVGVHTAAIVDSARLALTGAYDSEWHSPGLAALQALAGSLPLGVLIATERRHVWGNPAFCRMTGYAQSELGANLFRIHRSLARNRASTSPGELTAERRLYLTRSDRTSCPVRATFLDLSLFGGGYPMGYVAILEDLTEKSALELRLSHLQRLSTLGKLVSGIAHELNNPLTAVVGFAELVMAREDLPNDLHRDLEVIARHAERSTEVMRLLLDYVHLKPRDKVRVEVNAMLQELVRLHTYAPDARGVDITLNLAPSPVHAYGDPQQLQQVILNLIDNAEYACRSNGRTGSPDAFVAIHTESVPGQRVRISVRDNGPGIPEDVQPHVFEPFYTTKPIGKGTGLGLAISHEIVSQHQGRIWFESDPGTGTTFHVELPAGNGATASSAADGAPQSSQATAGPAHVLVVDDERSIRELLSKVLSRGGHTVDVAYSGEQAMSRLREGDYDVVFLDLKIPGMPGQFIYDWIKQHRADLRERTVILTGDVLNPDTLSFLEQERASYLLKPFQLPELRTLMERVWPG